MLFGTAGTAQALGPDAATPLGVGGQRSAVATLVDTGEAVGRVYNIGSDVPVSILELAERVIARVNPEAKIDFQSYSDAYDESFEDIRRRVPDLTRIRTTIGYRPTQDLDAIIDSVEEYQRAHAQA